MLVHFIRSQFKFPLCACLVFAFLLSFFYSMKEIKHFYCVCTGLSKLSRALDNSRADLLTEG